MGVSYHGEVARGQSLGVFRLLLRWRGSIYQAVFLEVGVWLLVWYCLNFSYRWAMNYEHRNRFEDFVDDFKYWSSSLSVSFFIGFFVTSVISRWWIIFEALPWINHPAYITQCLISGRNDPITAAQIRKTIMRYCNLTWVFVFRRYSVPVYKRFAITELPNERPLDKYRRSLQKLNDDEVVKETFGKLITESEIDVLVEMAAKTHDGKSEVGPEWWIGLHWIVRLLFKSKQKGFVPDQRAFLNLVEAYNSLRGGLGSIVIYADTTLPLLYTQVALIAVYSYYLFAIVASQDINPVSTVIMMHEAGALAQNVTIPTADMQRVDLYFPFFQILELMFLLGWYKTAMIFMNPFGEDDDDLDCNGILDYNLHHGLRSGNNRPYLYPTKLRETATRCTHDHNLEAALDNLDSDDENDEVFKPDQLPPPPQKAQVFNNPAFDRKIPEDRQQPQVVYRGNPQDRGPRDMPPLPPSPREPPRGPQGPPLYGMPPRGIEGPPRDMSPQRGMPPRGPEGPPRDMSPQRGMPPRGPQGPPQHGMPPRGPQGPPQDMSPQRGMPPIGPQGPPLQGRDMSPQRGMPPRGPQGPPRDMSPQRGMPTRGPQGPPLQGRDMSPQRGMPPRVPQGPPRDMPEPPYQYLYTRPNGPPLQPRQNPARY